MVVAPRLLRVQRYLAAMVAAHLWQARRERLGAAGVRRRVHRELQQRVASQFEWLRPNITRVE